MGVGIYVRARKNIELKIQCDLCNYASNRNVGYLPTLKDILEFAVIDNWTIRDREESLEAYCPGCYEEMMEKHRDEGDM